MADNEVGGWVVDPMNPNRATYTDPDTNQVYEAIDDPALAPQKQAAAPVQGQPTQAKPQEEASWLRQFGTNYQEAAQNGFAGTVARKWFDWSNSVNPRVKELHPEWNDDQIEAEADRIIAQSQKELISDLGTENSKSGWLPWLAGNLLGSAGPESAINPGGSASARIASQVGMGALSDAAYQGSQVADDVKDEYSVEQTLSAAAFGGGLQGVFEVPGFIKGLFKGRGSDTTPGADPLTQHSESVINPEVDAAQRLEASRTIASMVKTGAPDETIRKFAQDYLGGDGNLDQVLAYRAEHGNYEPAVTTPDGKGVPPSGPVSAEAANVQGGDPSVAAKLAEEANAFSASRNAAPTFAAAPAPEVAPTSRVQAAVDHVNDIAGKWENAPEIEIHENFDDLDLPSDAIGVTTPDGKVLINMANVDSRDVLSAVTFHEGLGHHGLTQKFGDDLDNILENLYYDGKDFGTKVDEWMAANPDAYADDVNPLARASEEVLAEMSEAGAITPSLMAKFRNWLKDFGRKAGLNLKYSDGEIKTILGMAHQATIKGAPTPSANGFRYKREANDNTKRTPAEQAQYAEDRILASEGVPHEPKYLEPQRFEETHPEDLERPRYKPQGWESGNGMNEREAAKATRQQWLRKQREEQADLEAVREPLQDNTKAESTAATKTLRATPRGETRIVQPHPNTMSDFRRFQHTAKDGSQIYGNYLLDEKGDIESFSINSDKGRNSVGAAAIREVARAIKAEHPNAKTVEGYRISGGRKASGKGQENISIDTLRFMKRKLGDSEGATPQGGNKNESELGLGKIRSKENIEGILQKSAPTATKESWDQWIGDAESIRQTVKQSKELRTGASAPEVLKARQHIVQSANRIAALSRKSVDGRLSPREEYQLMAEIARNADLQDALAGVRSNAARIVNSFKIEVGSDKAFSDAVRMMAQNVNNTVFSNPKHRAQLLQQAASLANNPRGVNTLIKNAIKPKAEDYIFRVWYNMLLSSPATHVANFVGTGGNFMADLLENTGAAALGQGKRFSNADRIRGREVAYRVVGALNALKSAETWRNTRESLNTGETGNSVNSKTGGGQVYTGTNKAAGFASGVLEAPSRGLAGADEFWRNILQLSNIYGLAVRNAGNKGLKGKAFRTEVENLINNPTPEMITATNDYTKVIQFMDKSSAIGKSLTDLQTPGPNSSGAGRVARGVLKAAVPFVRTPDSLIRTTIRRSGLLGAAERENLNGWKAGGAERDKVVARMIMGSALSFWLATEAYQGNITGAGPQDYQKNQEWAATHQPNSIKVGGKFYSISGLEPVSTNITGIATLVERLKNGEISQDDYAKSAISLIQGVGAVLKENSYLDGFTNLMDAASDDPNKAENALTNFFANLASSATTPAILRKYTQAGDTALRDTTGDGSFSDRLAGRIATAVPGLSDQLPQKYDVYGRALDRKIAGPDLFSRTQTRMEEDDPVIKELGRLAETMKGVLVGAPSKSNVKVNGVPRRLNAEEFQDYQHLSGYWIVESIRAELNTPEWKAMTDAERIDEIGSIKKDMRKAARETLFNPDGEEDTSNDE